MIATSLSDIIDDALGRTDREVDDVDSGWLLRIAKNQVRALWSLCVRLNPDLCTKTTPSFTIATGTTHTIGTGSTVTVTDYLSPRSLEYDPGDGVYRPLRPYRFKDRGQPMWLSYRVFNGVVDVQPAQLAGRFPLRLKYIYQPVFTDTDVVLDLPLGGDDWLAEGIAAKIRTRYEESTDEHLTAQLLAQQTVTRFLLGHGQGPPDQLPEAGDFPDDSGMEGF